MLGNTPPQDGLEIAEIGDVDDLIDAVHERAHGVVGGKSITEKHDEMFAAAGIRTLHHFAQKWVCFQFGVFEILVDHDYVVIVGLQLQDHVLFEQAKMHLVGHVDELRDHDLLVLLMIDTNERGVVTKIDKAGFVILFHNLNLVECVLGKVEAQTGIEIRVYAARFLN
jgi:hypothetical protein